MKLRSPLTVRSLGILFILCLAAVSCGGSASGSSDDGSGTETETVETETVEAEAGDTDSAAGCDGSGLSAGEIVGMARQITTENAGHTIAFGFFNSGDVVAEVNPSGNGLWEVAFTKDSGAIELLVTCGGDLDSISTSGTAMP